MSGENGANFDLSQLKNLVRQYIDQHMYKTALFWADKVYTLSKKEPQDCLWLAHALFLAKQFSRAVHLLKSNDLIIKNSAAKYLAARCLYEEKEFKAALETLESETNNNKLEFTIQNRGSVSVDRNSNNSSSSSVFAIHSNNRKLESSISLLKGMIHENFENKVLATKYYKDALQRDVYCFEAFDNLISHNLMNTSDEFLFFQTLSFSQQCSLEEEKLLKVVYGCKINKLSLPVHEKLPSYLELLKENLDYIVCNAEQYFNNYHYYEAFQLASFVYKNDPLHESCLPLYISCLVEFKMKNELYHVANKLVNNYPFKAVTWFAVGSYYLIIKKNEPARKYFSKATSIDINFGPAWLGFAHSYASEGERDQAISAYFSASKIMPGSHLPYLYLGLEYSLSNNFSYASKFYKEALAISPDDLHIRIELAVLGYENGEYEEAELILLNLLKKFEKSDMIHFKEIIYINLAHVLRKLKKLDEAIIFNQKALLFNPKCSSTYASIALCFFLKKNFKSAVDNCQIALSLKKHDTIAIQLLEQALDCLLHSKDHFFLDEEIVHCSKSEFRLSSSSIDLSCVTKNPTPSTETLESSTVEMNDSL
ncbi:cell division cycle protein 16 homolog isoform X3 [Hydra vulgaris]